MAVLAGVAVVSSCSDDDDDPRIETDKTSTGLTFAADATTAQIINVTSDVTGTVTATAKDNWATPAVNGKAISVTVSANTTDSERSTNITVGASGFSSVDVKVTQAAGGSSAILRVTPSPYEFPAAGEEKTFTVTTELEGWVATVAGTGFTKESETATTVVVKAAANTVATKREGTITFTHADLTAPVVVNLTQAAAKVTTKLTLSAGLYYGDTSANTTDIVLQMANDDESHFVAMQIYIPKTAFSASMTIPTGDYTFASTSAANTILPGFISGSSVYPSLIENPDGLYMVEGGTMNIASSGTGYKITMDLTGTEANTNAAGEFAYEFEGNFTFNDQRTKIPGDNFDYENMADKKHNVVSTPMKMNSKVDWVGTWEGNTYFEDLSGKGHPGAFLTGFGAQTEGFDYVMLLVDGIDADGNEAQGLEVGTGISLGQVDASTTLFFAAASGNTTDGITVYRSLIGDWDATAKKMDLTAKTQAGADVFVGFFGRNAAGQFTTFYGDCMKNFTFTMNNTDSDPVTRGVSAYRNNSDLLRHMTPDYVNGNYKLNKVQVLDNINHNNKDKRFI